MLKRTLAVIAAACTLSACASATHLTRQRTLTPNGAGAVTGTFIDAKQRVVLSARNPNSKTGDMKWSRVCAEPSPDALSALSASSTLGLEAKGLSVNQALALAESAGSIGLRTQSIQLMRDAMYRICEGHISGAISDLAFETLHRRLQRSMVAILAIEQLTGVVKGPDLRLSGDAGFGAPIQIESLTLRTATAKQSLDTADADTARNAQKLETAEADLVKAKSGSDATAITAAQAARDKQATATATSEVALQNAKAAYDRLDEARKAVLTGAASASGRAEGAMQASSDAAVANVSEAVYKIVATTFDAQFSHEFCTSIILEYARLGNTTKNYQHDNPETKILLACIRMLDAAAGAAEAESRRFHTAVNDAVAIADPIKRQAALVSAGGTRPTGQLSAPSSAHIEFLSTMRAEMEKTADKPSLNKQDSPPR